MHFLSLSSGFRHIKDFLFPPSCALCDAITDDHHSLCMDCWKKIDFTGHKKRCTTCHTLLKDEYGAYLEAHSSKECPECISKSTNIQANLIDHYQSILLYDHHSSSIIKNFKHNMGFHLLPILKKMMIFQSYSWMHLMENADIVVPIPLFWRRQSYRGFQQSAVLAHLFHDIFKKHHRKDNKNFSAPLLLPSLLKRRKNTKSLGHFNKQKRQEILRNAFFIPKRYQSIIENKHILLIDDVYTTGSTIHEAAKLLRAHGAKKISVITIFER